MTKGLRDSKAEIKTRSRKDEPTGATNKKNADTESLAAIQEKVTKFQPKIDALLPRMLSGSTAVIPTRDSSENTGRSRGASDAPLSEAIAKVSAGSRSAVVQSKSTTVKPATGSASTSTALAPKSRRVASTAASVSIADRIPKGSRTKPISTLVRTTAQPSTPTTKQAGNQPEEAIILLSSLPSFSQDVEELAISSADIGLLEREAGDLSDDEPLLDRRRQHPYTTEANATTNTTAPVAAAEQPTSKNDAPAKSFSIISIGSSKSDLNASIIPSIDNDRIKNWMGDVKEALGDNQDTLAASNTEKATITMAKTAERVPSTPGLEKTPTTTLPRRDDIVDENSDKGSARILAKDSLPSAPPVPLFHEDQGVRMSTMAVTAPRHGSSQDPDLADDVSTVLVGGQPTQDSFALQSLPSYYYEKDDKGLLSDSEQEEDADEFNSFQQPQSRHSPSLPSGLTASCLHELGLEKKRRNSGQGSRSVYQKRRTGEASTFEEEESAYETMVLAQGDVFPSSIGEAPASSLLRGSASLSSFDLPDPPRYTYALPDRADRQQQDDDIWDLPQGQEPNRETDDDDTQEYHQPIEIQDSLSFPLPPSQTSFTVSLPTMPTFPSTIPSEPSLIIVGSQPPETQESGEET
ncbi:hypothetical protein BGZ68_000018 [Mortierella alpina]|nr:hypothetical protein BGZ68_000018 [Mortierella alpina]